VDSRVNDVLSASQKLAANTLSPYLDGKFQASLSTYTYAYDAPQLVSWAANHSHSDTTSALVSALQSLGAHPAKTGALGGIPGYNASYHGYAGGKWYGVNITGAFTDGTLPSVRTVPNCMG
jgi:hypothetical protein